ncbi:TIGR02391 family protein [Chitinophaga silvatica]|uniref:TIGR02391 family protein n=1 Tax=Chitinophaga silvatica TaxID=2282649 RepID=A0A3E1Y8W3_9BACT|nr:TIGR02391 family protein [Chitinophaga silvatica]RFS21843.1 TIGR02391 family protein [Chitinophaga silvatica]
MSIGNKKPIIQSFHLEGICKVIADTDQGLKGTEIGQILADSNIWDTDPGITKWKRLYNAFVYHMNTCQDSTKILVFLCRAMHPSRYLNNTELYQFRLNELNKQLSFIGYEITNTGKYSRINATTTLTEAQHKASHFKSKLEARNVHKEIIKFCNAELLVENYFHAVLEGVKSVNQRLRELSNLHADGVELVDTAFKVSAPLIRINLLQNDSEKSAHTGLANLIRGIMGYIRNPTAHLPKALFVIEEDEALDMMTTISMIHKKLDKTL